MKNFPIKNVVRRLLDLTLRDVSGRGKILNQALLSLNRTSKSGFYTFHQRPKAAKDVHFDAAAEALRGLPLSAIVLQGPLVHQDDFTLESARLYRRLMPGTIIIVSTWSNEPGAALRRLESEGFKVIASAPPKVSGANNVNFQIVSTRAGIELAKELGCEFVLKSRCDQRFYAPNLLPFFLALLDEYPPVEPLRQSRRIIELSMSICRFRPYSMCDMFQFGHINDLWNMWSAHLDPRQISSIEYGAARVTPRKISEDRIAEIYVHRAYLESIGVDATVDLARYYKILADYFVVLDKEAVDLFWNKYHTKEYGLADNPLYDSNRVKSRFYNRDWNLVRRYGVDALDTSEELMDVVEN